MTTTKTRPAVSPAVITPAVFARIELFDPVEWNVRYQAACAEFGPSIASERMDSASVPLSSVGRLLRRLAPTAPAATEHGNALAKFVESSVEPDRHRVLRWWVDLITLDDVAVRDLRLHWHTREFRCERHVHHTDHDAWGRDRCRDLLKAEGPVGPWHVVPKTLGVIDHPAPLDGTDLGFLELVLPRWVDAIAAAKVESLTPFRFDRLVPRSAKFVRI